MIILNSSKLSRQWEDDFAKANDALNEVRDARLKSSSFEQSNDSSSRFISISPTSIQRKMNRLNKVIVKLDKDLSRMEHKPPKYHVSANELTRRRKAFMLFKHQVDNLKTFEVKNSEYYQATSAGHLSGILFSENEGDYSNVQRIHATSEKNQKILQDQRKQIEQQDDALNQVNKDIDNLQQINFVMNDETNMQARLLSDLENGIADTNISMQKQTERAALMSKQKGTCMLYIAIVILIVVLVLLISLKA